MKKITIIFLSLISTIVLIFLGILFYDKAFGEIRVLESCAFDTSDPKEYFDRADTIFIGKVVDYKVDNLGMFDEGVKDVYYYNIELIQDIEGEFDDEITLINKVPNKRVNMNYSFICTVSYPLRVNTVYLFTSSFISKLESVENSDKRTSGFDYYNSAYQVELDGYNLHKSLDEQSEKIKEKVYSFINAS